MKKDIHNFTQVFILPLSLLFLWQLSYGGGQLTKVQQDLPWTIREIEPLQFELRSVRKLKKSDIQQLIKMRSKFIAEKDGFGSLRIIDQIKRNRITHPVTADDVRALAGVVYLDHNVSKGIVTTSGVFAPNVEKDELIRKVLPYRLELRDRDILIPWLQRLSGR